MALMFQDSVLAAETRMKRSVYDLDFENYCINGTTVREGNFCIEPSLHDEVSWEERKG
jgi:hypothetical protein